MKTGRITGGTWMIQEICNWIVLISAVTLAVTNIYKFFKKPVDVVQKHQDEQLEKKIEQQLSKVLPDILNKQSTEMMTARHCEYKDLLEQVDHMLVERTSDNFQEIKDNIQTQGSDISILKKTTLDLLRNDILEIYHKNKAKRQLIETDREYLDDLFRDYSAEGGNSYIAKKYYRMTKWEIIADDEDDEEI